MKITSWNINSVRKRIDLIDKLNEEINPDILCLQECKCQDADFPFDALKAKGYAHIAYYGMKGYNGVAICSRQPLVKHGRMEWTGKDDARHIWADIEAKGGVIRVHNVYIPAGGDEPDVEKNPKFAHKLDFVKELAHWSENTITHSHRQVILGDFNIAPSEYDVWSHKQLLKIISHTPVEVDLLTQFLQKGHWVDAIRHYFPEPEKLYSWWSYRAKDWQKSNRGRRLDHIWVTPDLKDFIKSADIYAKGRSWAEPSDHCPLSLILDI